VKGFCSKAFFFVVAAAYSQLFCGLLSKHLLVSELNNAHIIRRVFLDYNFQWMTLAWQLESCMSVCSCSSWKLQFLEHISQRRVAMHLRCGGILNNHMTANLMLNQPVKEFWKSVKIWHSYCYDFGGLLFWNIMYITKMLR